MLSHFDAILGLHSEFESFYRIERFQEMSVDGDPRPNVILDLEAGGEKMKKGKRAEMASIHLPKFPNQISRRRRIRASLGSTQVLPASNDR